MYIPTLSNHPVRKQYVYNVSIASLQNTIVGEHFLPCQHTMLIHVSHTKRKASTAKQTIRFYDTSLARSQTPQNSSVCSFGVCTYLHVHVCSTLSCLGALCVPLGCVHGCPLCAPRLFGCPLCAPRLCAWSPSVCP